MKENVIQEKSFEFAVKVVITYKDLCKEYREYTLFTQFLKSGTSIGANIEEAIGGQSKKDFIAKMSIAYKEIRECKFWVRLMRKTSYISQEKYDDLMEDLHVMHRIIVKILTKSKENSVY